MLDHAAPHHNTQDRTVTREDFGRVVHALEHGAPDEEVLARIQRLVHAFPSMSLPLLEAVAPHFPALRRDAVQALWATAMRNDELHYPEHAQRLMELCVSQAQLDPSVALEDLMLLRGGEQQAKAFGMCHARAEIIRPGSGRTLAGQIAMRALRYPIVDFWSFTEAPLVAILEREPAPGFQVAVAGGSLPWLAAWVMAVREIGQEAHEVGVRATFQRLMDAGAGLEEDIEGGSGGLALELACNGADVGEFHAALAVHLLMEAGADWTHIQREAGSTSDQLLLEWPQVRRSRLGAVCGPAAAEDVRRAM